MGMARCLYPAKHISNPKPARIVRKEPYLLGNPACERERWISKTENGRLRDEGLGFLSPQTFNPNAQGIFLEFGKCRIPLSSQHLDSIFSDHDTSSKS